MEGWGGGNICEATTLWKESAACPPVCKAASCISLSHTHTNKYKRAHGRRRTHDRADTSIKCNKSLVGIRFCKYINTSQVISGC